MGQGQSAPKPANPNDMQCWTASDRLEAKNPVEHWTKIPQVRPGTILIRVAAAGIHPHDIVRPAHTHGNTYPCILGTDGVGFVHEVGEEVTGWVAGDLVMFRSPARNIYGSWAQFCLCDARFVVRYPDGCGLAFAAVIPTPWWSAQILYEYYAPRSGDSIGTCMIVGADCENGLELYLCDLLKAAPVPWEVFAIVDDRKEAIYVDHGFDCVIPAKAIPRHENNGPLNIAGALAARGRDRPYCDLIVILKSDLAGVRDGNDLATIAKFGVTVVCVDSTATGAGLKQQPTLTQMFTGADLVSPMMLSVSAAVRLFSLDAWAAAMPNIVATIAQRGPPARMIYTESVSMDKARDAVVALAEHRVRTKVAVIVAPPPTQSPTGSPPAEDPAAPDVSPAEFPVPEMHATVDPVEQEAST
eukprot:TRINITY_DN21020_c0_g1_i1.p1 TRINITY_DN21020_c0_g1~~TRINITY_DN21020_c0_g1_i1.p1  ORF type:complete len:414 (-),score=78.26 TRINITY_DN21020_c0_g1_i1:165-1406(-)